MESKERERIYLDLTKSGLSHFYSADRVKIYNARFPINCDIRNNM